MAAETMAIGLLWLVFSLPLVTAGGAWCAAAEVTAAWQRGEEPPLVRTFVQVTRRDLRAGLGLIGIAVGVFLTIGLDAWIAAGMRLPGYLIEVAALGVVGAGFLAATALTVALRAATGCDWRTAIATIRAPAVLGWRAPALVVVAMGLAAALVLIVPAFAGFIAGPIAFAASVAVTRLGVPIAQSEAGK
jgi:uncharacterized membrane protein YesL